MEESSFLPETALPRRERQALLFGDLTVDRGSEPEANEFVKQLRKENIYTDTRDGVVRFGFGLYTTFDLIDKLFAKLRPADLIVN